MSEPDFKKFQNEEISAGGIGRSFKHAFRGLFVLSVKERNVNIQILIAVIVVLLGIYFELPATEWFFIILAIVVVIVAELFNTAIESMLDLLHPQFSERVRNVKDLSAGAVLLAVIGAVIIGLVIFVPKIIEVIV